MVGCRGTRYVMDGGHAHKGSSRCTEMPVGWWFSLANAACPRLGFAGAFSVPALGVRRLRQCNVQLKPVTKRRHLLEFFAQEDVGFCSVCSDHPHFCFFIAVCQNHVRHLVQRCDTCAASYQDDIFKPIWMVSVLIQKERMTVCQRRKIEGWDNKPVTKHHFILIKESHQHPPHTYTHTRTHAHQSLFLAFFL